MMVSATCEVLSEAVGVCGGCGSPLECPHPACLPPVTLDILEVRQKPILMT